MKIRIIRPIDAANFLYLCQKIDNETPNMLLSLGERQLTIAEQEKNIIKLLNDEFSNIWVVEHNSQLIGYLIVVGNSSIRKKHSAYIVIGILQEFTSQGIGTKLFNHLINWAEEQGLHRLELTVRATNKPAIGLYKKMCFVTEGIKKDSLCINSKYEDELYMAKFISIPAKNYAIG